MSWETYTKIFENGIPYAVKLNWRGEPLLHDKLVDMIKYAKQKGVIEVLLNTNGLLLDKNYIWALGLSGLDWLIFSVDGATKETYERIRQGGDFDKLVQNLKLTWEIFNTITPRPKIRIQICNQIQNQNEINLWKTKFGKYADELRIGKLYDPQGKFGWNIKQPYSCPQLWQRLVVSWDGNIFACPADFLEEFCLGNIESTSIEEAWGSFKLNNLRLQLKKFGRSKTALCKVCTSYC